MRRPKLPTHWRQKNGVVIAIRDMDDSHLTNTILMIGRAAEKASDYIFQRDLAGMTSFATTCRGDGATMAIESAISQLRPHTVAEILHTWPIWHAFREEADRRAAAQGFVPLPEEVVCNVPEDKDVPEWTKRNPKDEPAPTVPTQRRRTGRVFSDDEELETNWGDDGPDRMTRW